MNILIKVIAALSLLIVVGVSALVYSVNSAFHKPLLIGHSQVLTVDSSMYANGIIEDLSERSILRSPLLIKLALKMEPEMSQIKAGTYELKFGMSVRDLFFNLSNGKEMTFMVQLIEGLTWKDWLEQLNSTANLIPSTLTDEQWLALLEPSFEATSMEGMLLPDTYQYTAGSKVEDIVNRAHLALTEFLQTEWQMRELDLPYNTPYEALILASIVEKETGLASERSRIAGVFVNRLRLNMRLQTDPTVIYGMGDKFDGNIRRKDLKQATPYNTYVIKGLPPTPISMMSKLAITATLNPMVTDELYFVSKGDGSHQFSVTLDQHNKAVRKYQLKK